MNMGTDNDLAHDESVENGLFRTNAFGQRGNGSVTDGDGGTWRYGWTFRAVYDNDLEFRARRAVPHGARARRLSLVVRDRDENPVPD